MKSIVSKKVKVRVVNFFVIESPNYDQLFEINFTTKEDDIREQ